MTYRPLAASRLVQRGFRGMRDVVTPEPQDQPDTAMLIHNMLPLDPVGGGPVVTRPSFGTPFATPAYTQVLQLAFDYFRLDSVHQTIAVLSGQVYTLGSTGFTLLLSTATLAGAGVTLSASARCHAAQLAGKVIISDGVNTPFMWDGPSNTVTKLINCPVLYGPLTIYYAKLFGIKAVDRETIVWSEENDPTTGYEAGGFNDSWTLGQSGSSPLQCLLGTNQGLFFWRPTSIGWIRGAVTTTFQADGTRDGVSETCGTTSPDSVTIVDNTIYWVDQQGRPWRMQIGADPQPLFPQMQRRFDFAQLPNYLRYTSGKSYGDGYVLDLSTAGVGAVMTAFLPALRLVVFGYALSAGFPAGNDSGSQVSSAGQMAYFVVFHHDTASLQAYWTPPWDGFGTGPGVAYLSTITRDDLGESSLFVFLGGTISTGISNGYFLSASNAVLDVANGAQVEQYVIGHPQGLSDDTQIAFDRLDVSVGARPGGGTTPTNAELGAALQTGVLQVSNELSGPIFTNDANLTSGNTADQLGNYRNVQCSFGFAEEGRWARVLLRLVQVYRTTFINGWTLEAKAKTRAPAANTAGT